MTTKPRFPAGTRAGVREVRDRFTRFLARVRAGETVVITDRGVPVAILKPPTAETTWEERKAQMVAEGLLIPSKRRTNRKIKQISLPPGVSLSQAVIDQNEDSI